MNSQKVVHQRPSYHANRRLDDNSAFSMTHSCVQKYLSEPSERPQRMTVTCGQSVETQFISLTVDEISRDTALQLAESQYFHSAFHLSDNRKALRKACDQARNFYKEHVIDRNPFPPKHKFKMVWERPKKEKKEEEKRENGTENVRKTESSLSLVEGTMSLTSMASHSQLSVTSSSHPVNLKTTKKPRKHIPDSLYFHSEQRKEHVSKEDLVPIIRPPLPRKGPKDENRLMNTFNTSE